MAVAITGSVGQSGKNNTADVTAIQTLLNKWITPPIAVNGVCSGKTDDPTVKAIKAFQSKYTSNPDGRVDPGGGTLKRLNSEPFVLLPQMSGFGYYSYGKGDWSQRQWGTKATIDTLLDIAKQYKWNNPTSQIAIGDISFQFGGHMSPHSTHRDGIHVDLRPCRKDDLMLPVTYTAAEYDQTKTKLLIETFLSHRNVKNILFNDPEIYKLDRVSYWEGHHDHFHVTMLS